jgi:DNA mismatch repair protein MutL
MEVQTRTREQTTGQLLRLEGGEITRQESVGHPPGTIATVEYLFQNVPARLKFLRRPQTEAGHIHSMVTRYALAYPEILFSLTAEGRPMFQSAGRGHLYDVVIGVFGLEIAEKMLAIEEPRRESMAPFVSGYTGTPALHRANRRYITLFANRRWIQDRSLAYAVAQAYHTMLPVSRHPVAVIFLELDPAQIDVNVHPTKREVRFRDGNQVFGAVQRAVRRTLIEHAPVPAMLHRPRTWPTPEWERHQALVSASEGEPVSTQLAMELYRTQDGGEELQPVGAMRLPLLRVVGQVGQTYIVAEGPQGMYLIDQHAAHERVLYEQMMGEYKNQDVKSQALLEPLMLDLDPLLAGTLSENLRTLNLVGFCVEPFGGTSFLMRSVPAILVTPDIRGALEDILELLRQGEDLLASGEERRLIAAVCKRAAVKAGQTLSREEMQQLIRQLEQCESPRTCPHGRPTVLHFSVEQLEKEFGRK